MPLIYTYFLFYTACIGSVNTFMFLLKNIFLISHTKVLVAQKEGGSGLRLNAHRFVACICICPHGKVTGLNLVFGNKDLDS